MQISLAKTRAIHMVLNTNTAPEFQSSSPSPVVYWLPSHLYKSSSMLVLRPKHAFQFQLRPNKHPNIFRHPPRAEQETRPTAGATPSPTTTSTARLGRACRGTARARGSRGSPGGWRATAGRTRSGTCGSTAAGSPAGTAPGPRPGTPRTRPPWTVSASAPRAGAASTPTPAQSPTPPAAGPPGLGAARDGVLLVSPAASRAVVASGRSPVAHQPAPPVFWFRRRLLVRSKRETSHQKKAKERQPASVKFWSIWRLLRVQDHASCQTRFEENRKGMRMEGCLRL